MLPTANSGKHVIWGFLSLGLKNIWNLLKKLEYIVLYQAKSVIAHSCQLITTAEAQADKRVLT